MFTPASVETTATPTASARGLWHRLRLAGSEREEPAWWPDDSGFRALAGGGATGVAALRTRPILFPPNRRPDAAQLHLHERFAPNGGQLARRLLVHLDGKTPESVAIEAPVPPDGAWRGLVEPLTERLRTAAEARSVAFEIQVEFRSTGRKTSEYRCSHLGAHMTWAFARPSQGG